MAMLVDVGYLNTEVSVVEGDAITYHAMLPLGGGQITADLCEELRIPMRAAEQIKRRYVFDPDEFDQDAYAEVAGANGERLSFRANTSSARWKEHGRAVRHDRLDAQKTTPRAFWGRARRCFDRGGIALMRGGREYLATSWASGESAGRQIREDEQPGLRERSGGWWI